MIEYKKNIKHRCLAAFLLGLFVFANTPKIFLHDAVTQHHHSFHDHSKCNPAEKHITSKSINCSTDNLVIDIAFDVTPFSILNFHSYFFVQHNTYFNCTYDLYRTEGVNLRGPPAC